jgi:type IV pilus assembly protein PilC
VSTYVFKAMDVAGAPLRGQVDAESKQAVSDQLRARGLVILEIAEKHSSREINVALFERITLSDLAIFSRQLATMVSSGMTILRALFVLEEQTETKKLKTVIVCPSASRSPAIRRSSARSSSR